MKKQNNNTVSPVPLARLVRRGRGHEYKLWVYEGPKSNPRFVAGITFDCRNPPDKNEMARWERAIQAGLDAEFNSPPNVQAQPPRTSGGDFSDDDQSGRSAASCSTSIISDCDLPYEEEFVNGDEYIFHRVKSGQTENISFMRRVSEGDPLQCQPE